MKLRALILAIAFTAGGRAACPINLSLTAYPNAISVDAQTTNSSFTGIRVSFFAPSRGHANWQFRDETAFALSGSANRAWTIYGLAPATTYILDPQVVESGVWSSYQSCQTELCPNGEGAQPGGYPCVEVDAAPACGGSACYAPTVTTAAAEASYPAPPADPILTLADPFTVPTVTGTSRNVDPSGNNVQAQMNACTTAAEADGLVHEIVIPAGLEVRPELEGLGNYTLPNLSQGTCILRCGAAAKYLPPAGVAIHPDYWRTGELCRMYLNRNAEDSNSTAGVGEMLTEEATVGAKGWRFIGIKFGAPDPADLTEQEHAITAFNVSDGTITSAAHGLAVNDLISIELTGVENAFAHRGNCTVTSVTTDTFKCSGVSGFEGTFSSGAWTADVSRRLTGCTSGGLCETVGTHPYGNFHTYSIVSFNGTALQLSDSTLKMNAGASIKVSGTTGGCDGIYGIGSVSGDTVTTDQAAPAICTGGTARQVGMILLGGTDTPSAHDAYIAEFPDSTHVQILQPALPGATVGGWFSYDPPMPNLALIDLTRSSDIVFDRCWIAMPDPWRLRKGIDAGFATRIYAVASYGSGFMPYVPRDPNSGHGNSQTGGSTSNAAGVWINAQNLTDSQVRRVRTSGVGSIFFSDNLAGTQTGDLLFESIEDWKSPRMVPGRAEAGNVARLLPNVWEVKKGVRIKIDGYAFFGEGSVRQPSGAPILASFIPFQDGHAMTDLQFLNGQIYAASCIEIVNGGSTYATTYSGPPVGRIRIDNLICDAQRSNVGEADTLIGAPGGQQLETVDGLGASGAGFFLRVTDGENVDVQHVTARVRGRFPIIHWLGGRRHHALRYVNSIFVAGENNTWGDIYGDGNNWDTTVPAISASARGYELWTAGAVEGPGAADPNSDNDNIWIPGSTTNILTSTWLGTANDYASTLASRLSCGGACPGNFQVVITGSDGETPQFRQDAILQAGKWTKKVGLYPGYGHDITAIEDKLLRLRNVNAAGIVGGVRLTYTAPPNTTCYWQRTATTPAVALPDWTGASDWVDDGGGESASRQLDVTSLSGGSVYWFRGSCGLHEVLVRGRAL